MAAVCGGFNFVQIVQVTPECRSVDGQRLSSDWLKLRWGRRNRVIRSGVLSRGVGARLYNVSVALRILDDIFGDELADQNASDSGLVCVFRLFIMCGF